MAGCSGVCAAVGAAQPSMARIPACGVCGRQDETLCYVSLPFVFSLVFLTFRRAFERLWCSWHRQVRTILAGLISSSAGWLGIPFGFLLTPLALGGDLPSEYNASLLRMLAERRPGKGDAERALRCYEAALEVGSRAGHTRYFLQRALL